MTPSISTLTVAFGAIVLPVNSPQVTTVGADLKQLPIEVLLIAGTLTELLTRPVRSVFAGNVRLIWLPAAWDSPPVEEVVNPTVWIVLAPAAADGGVSVIDGAETGWAPTIENVLEFWVSEVVSTMSVLPVVVGALMTPSISTLTVAFGAIVLPVNSPQVTTVGADLKQLPIEVLLIAGTLTELLTRPVRSVFAGNVRLIWLPAAWDSPPVEEVVKPTV